MSPIVQAARRYLGVKWRHQGRGENYLDCAGLVVRAYADCGMQLKDLEGYGRTPWNDGLVDALADNFRLIDGDIQYGDVLLFRITRYPQHIGIATDKGIIHSHSSVHQVVEHGLDKYWLDRIVGIYRK